MRAEPVDVGLRLQGGVQQRESAHDLRVVGPIRCEVVSHLQQFRIGLVHFVYRVQGEPVGAFDVDALDDHDPSIVRHARQRAQFQVAARRREFGGQQSVEHAERDHHPVRILEVVDPLRGHVQQFWIGWSLDWSATPLTPAFERRI